MADPASDCTDEDDLLRDEASGVLATVTTPSVTIPLEEWNKMKDTQWQLLAAIKSGTLGKTPAQSVPGTKTTMEDSSDEYETSDGDTRKVRKAQKVAGYLTVL